MLKVDNISFGYSNSLVLKNISFQAKKGEHISIIGESGSGKSTLLKLLYGEIDVLEGVVFWNETSILGPKYNLIVGYDFMKYVAQEFDLMPYITVEENIGKYLSRFYTNEKLKRINELIEVVELQEYAKTKVQYLSGGQKQRVALARALAKEPEIILLDEPFSHIDNFKKRTLRRSLFSFLKQQNITCIVATHDKEDAMPFSDRIIVLHEGEIVSNETPQNLYNNPKEPLIASFFDEYNMFDNDLIKYAHQLKIVEHSSLKAEVINSYFKGDYWLIEVNHNNISVFIKHQTSLEENAPIYFEIL
ncbi:MAG: ABC transporter ATP-binding protein [Flavobacteriaceae bacterium]|nr:ABC transporter ATP-binding protein [Bacteroidia bacterium]NNK81534.1 ABC transporter ATP-binding protein [Flavobacteriaceae bacterium]